MSLITDGLMAHQATGARWLLDNPRGMLAWQMRCGKTATALRAWECSASGGPLLVLCPATGRENWRREALRFTVDPEFPPDVQILSSQSEPIRPGADVVITNYDKLLNPKFVQRLRGKGRWGAIILDEAHKLKNSTAQRTKVIYGDPGGRKGHRPLIGFSDRIWPLTGTPMPNNPAELWSHAYHLWPEAIHYNGHPMELWEWELAFCEIHDGLRGRQIVGGKNLAELKQRLTPHIHRLRLRDVIDDMPSIHIDTWPLDLGETTSGLRVPSTPELMGELARFGTIEKLDNAGIDALLACIQAEAVHLGTLRRETGSLKAMAVVLLVADEIEAGCPKTVIFAYHRSTIETLATGLKAFEPAVIHGGTPTDQRHAEVDRFQTDENSRVFIGQLQAAGEVIDLTAASNLIFAEADWSPSTNEQALFRVLGVNQRNPVHVRFAYLRGSIDEAVNRAIARKAAMIAQVVE